jgi:hypothetical protein
MIINTKYLTVKGLCGNNLPILNDTVLYKTYNNIHLDYTLNIDIPDIEPYCTDILCKDLIKKKYYKTELLKSNEEWGLSKNQTEALKNSDFINSGIMYGKRNPHMNKELTWLLFTNIKNDDKELRFLYLKLEDGTYTIDPNAITYISYTLCNLFRIDTIKEIDKAFSYSRGLLGYLEDIKLQIRIMYLVIMSNKNNNKWDELPNDFLIKNEMHGTPSISNVVKILNSGLLLPSLNSEHGDNWIGNKNHKNDKGRVYTSGSFKKAWIYSNSRKYFRRLIGDIFITKSNIDEQKVKKIKQNEISKEERDNHNFWEEYDVIMLSTINENGKILTENYEVIYNNNYPIIESLLGIFPAYLDINYRYELNKEIWGDLNEFQKIKNEYLAPWMQAMLDIHNLKRLNKKRSFVDLNIGNFNINSFNIKKEVNEKLLTLDKLKLNKKFPINIVLNNSILFNIDERCDMNNTDFLTEEYMKYMSHDKITTSNLKNNEVIEFNVNDIIFISQKSIHKKWINYGFINYHSIDKLRKYKIIKMFSEGFGKPKQVYIIPNEFVENENIDEYIFKVNNIKKNSPIIAKWLYGEYEGKRIPTLKVQLSNCIKY